jgi:predicted kinase
MPRSARASPCTNIEEICMKTPSDQTQSVGRLHWIVGPVGAGKSTLALELARKHRAVRMNLDDWMAELFRADRPENEVMAWYHERTTRCLAQIWKLSEQLVALGTDVVLELGLIQQSSREPFWRQLDESGHGLTIYVLDAPRALRRERVARRNHEQGVTFSMVVPDAVFELASDLWQPLDPSECAGRDVRFLSADPPS